MPEIPDLTIYIEALEECLVGHTITGIRIANPFVLRTVKPDVKTIQGKKILASHRIGKQLVLTCESDLYIVIHLMIAGRLRWCKAGAKLPGKFGMMAFDSDTSTPILTEASPKKRASVHLVQGEESLKSFNKGGIEVLDSSLDEFRTALSIENHTLKRSLTDQRFLAGIGNAYSDEILHRARISPIRQTRHLTDDQWQALHTASKKVICEWVSILRDKYNGGFPSKMTLFHDEMSVHGKYRQPCPDCGKPVQRIRYATNECNYCAECQNQGTLLADRSLSRLLKKDWPKTLEELDQV